MRNSKTKKARNNVYYAYYYLYLLALLLSSPFISAAQISCTYQLQLYDSFGDGWDDSFVSISINDQTRVYTLGDGDDDEAEQLIDLMVQTGDSLVVRYGTNPSPAFQKEISYRLLDSEGFPVFQDGPIPMIGTVFQTAVFCPTCFVLNPGSIRIDSVTAFTATFSWALTQGEQVQVEYGATGFEVGTGQQIATMDTSVVIDNLLENTLYEAYLRKQCANGDTSRISGPYTFTTPFLTPPDTCLYTIRMIDFFGDGWNGASITVNVNGASTEYTLLAESALDIAIPALKNLPFQVTYNRGPFDEEVSYIVFNPAGDVILSDGPNPDTGRVVDIFACPSCPLPTDLQIDAAALSATLDWEEIVEVDNYVLEYGETGFELGTGLEIIEGQSFATFTNLEEKQTYDYYLFSTCPNQDTSIQIIGPNSFQTRYLKDVGIKAITMPGTTCGLGVSEMIEIELTNYGANPQTLIPFKFSINGIDGGVPIPTDGLFTNIISKDSIALIQFETPANLSETGIYEIAVWTELEGDSDLANDTATVILTNIPTIQTFPYSEDFSTDAGGWTVATENQNASWEFGVPNGIELKRAFSGNQVWATKLQGAYLSEELSYLVSPCMDFSSLTTDPLIGFRFFMDTPRSADDQAWLELSIDGGRWKRVGPTDGSINWYNNEANTHWTNNASLGNWLYAEDSLANTAGVANVRLRFVFSTGITDQVADGFALDDVHIFPTDALNLVARLAVNDARTGCGAVSDSVILFLKNSGSAAVNQFSVSYQVNEEAVITETVDTLLVAGTSLFHYFQTPFNSSDLGDYQIKSWVTLAGETVPISDTTYYYFEVPPPNPLPLIEDFNDASVDEGWSALQGGASFIPAMEHNNESVVLSSNMWFGSPILEFVTTNYGPINKGDSLSFDYRFAEWPGATIPVDLAGDSLTVAVSTDCGATFTSIRYIHEGNHQPTADFTTVHVPLRDYVGEGIALKFLVNWGAGDYWFDIDNINILSCPADLGLTATVVDASSETATDGAIEIVPLQGSGTYIYNWQVTTDDTDSLGNLETGTYIVQVTDSLLGCQDTISAVVGVRLPTALEEIDLVSSFSLHPNPTNGIAQINLQLQTPASVAIEVFNIMGQSVLRLPPSLPSLRLQQALPLDGFPKGIYWVRIGVKDQLLTRKLIKVD